MRKTAKIPPHEVPGGCVLFPQVIADDQGFYVGVELDGLTPGTMRAHVAVKSIKELARREGMVDAATVEELELRLETAETARDVAEGETHRLEAELESLAGMRRHGFTIQKNMGRPKKEKAA